MEEVRNKVSEYTILPLSARVLIRKDDDKKETKGGIILPDSSEVPVITGRIVEISPDLADNSEFPAKTYDKVIVNPSRAIPVDLEHGNKLYIIPAKDVIAVFRKNDRD